jgi:hypothetical protein
MAYSAIPTRTSTDTNASADINQLQDNIEGVGTDGLYSNVIINGRMEIAQRGTTFTSIADQAYSLDRWVYENSAAAVFTITQDTDVPSSDVLINSLKLDCTTADTSLAAGDVGYFGQRIEGYNFAPFFDKTFTLKFWVKSTITGTFCVAFVNGASDKSYISEYTISAANTWEQKTITVTHSSTGTWPTDNTECIQVSWTLFSGTTYHTTADTWASGQYYATSNQANVASSTDNNFWLTGVQLALNDHDYTPRGFARELILCQRYFEMDYDYGDTIGGGFNAIAYEAFRTNGHANSDHTISHGVRFKVRKRATPTIVCYDVTNPGGATADKVTMKAGAVNSNEVGIGETGFTEEPTNGAASTGRLLAFHWTADAEL